MKRIILSIAIVTLFSLAGKAQKNLKVDLDVYNIAYEYVQLPETKIPEDKRTYKITVNNGSDYAYAYSNELFAEKIFLNGSKLDPANAAVKVEIQLNNMILKDLGVKTEEKRDNNGNVTSVSYTYGVQVNGDGKYIIIYNGIRKEFPLTYTKTISDKTSDRNATYSYYNYTNQRTIKENNSRTFSDNAINTVSDMLNKMYGYRVVQSTIGFQVVNNETNPDYAAHKETYQKVKEVLSQIQYTTDVTTLREELKASIASYEAIKNKYSDPEDRKHKKMRYASISNTMYIYYILDMFDEATKEADACIANDFDKNGAEGLKNTIYNDLKLLKTSGLTTRHCEIEPLYIR